MRNDRHGIGRIWPEMLAKVYIFILARTKKELSPKWHGKNCTENSTRATGSICIFTDSFRPIRSHQQRLTSSPPPPPSPPSPLPFPLLQQPRRHPHRWCQQQDPPSTE